MNLSPRFQGMQRSTSLNSTGKKKLIWDNTTRTHLREGTQDVMEVMGSCKSADDGREREEGLLRERSEYEVDFGEA
ncbi:ABC drug exporter AtrF [Sesbania bispinosa]|nr:ABC drug exporter AtrF [Sesbania bispinosa]